MIQGAVRQVAPITISHIAFVPPIAVPVPAESLQAASAASLVATAFGASFWTEALSVVVTAFTAVRFESVFAADALTKSTRPRGMLS